jgi:ABC-type lipoprotein release transport system permease subunit
MKCDDLSKFKINVYLSDFLVIIVTNIVVSRLTTIIPIYFERGFFI